MRRLCEEADIDFSLMKQWYDGYTLEGKSIYNPNAVMEALRNRAFASYWTETSASKSLMDYISLDFDGLSKTMAELLGGVDVLVDTFGFANDLVTFRDKNDVLILDTVQGNEAAVAEQIERIHGEETSPLFYNDEQALRSVVKLVYFSYRDYYIKFEELPSGDGYVDLVYLPKKLSPLPALVIELKWNQSAAGQSPRLRPGGTPRPYRITAGRFCWWGIPMTERQRGRNESIPVSLRRLN